MALCGNTAITQWQNNLLVNRQQHRASSVLGTMAHTCKGVHLRKWLSKLCLSKNNSKYDANIMIKRRCVPERELAKAGASAATSSDCAAADFGDPFLGRSFTSPCQPIKPSLNFLICCFFSAAFHLPLFQAA